MFDAKGTEKRARSYEGPGPQLCVFQHSATAPYANVQYIRLYFSSNACNIAVCTFLISAA